MNENQDSLNQLGFLVLRQALSPRGVQHGQRCMSNDKRVNYKCMLKFIDDYMMPEIDKALDWSSVHVKIRASDNNNSSDAGSFHRDISQHHPGKIFPVFTCLSYLDVTTMELIPQSHLFPNMSHAQAIHMFAERIQVKLYPGDLLVFYSTLLHRGIFTENLPHRRLIQVFDVYPNRQTYEQFSPYVVHIPSSKDRMASSGFWIRVYKNKMLSSVVNWFGYLNSATGYGYAPNQNALPEVAYYSSEGAQGRFVPSGQDTFEPGNKYIVRQPTLDVDESSKPAVLWNQYSRQLVLYILLLILVLIIVGYLIYYIVRPSKTVDEPEYNTSTSSTFESYG